MSATSHSFHAFTDELMLIKVAEEEKQKLDMETPGGVPAKGHSPLRVVGNLLAGGAAYGVGSGAARLIAMGVSKMMPGINNQKIVDYIAGGTGLLAAAGTMAFADAMAQNMRMLSEPSKRDE